MLGCALLTAALAGEILVDARVPAEIFVDGRPMAQLYVASVLRLPADPGDRQITVMVGGSPVRTVLTVPEVGATTLLVGRTGITVEKTAEIAAPEGVGRVEFRASGNSSVVVQIDDARHKIGLDQTLVLDLAQGEHRLIVRDGSSTVIWARGTLKVTGGSSIVQISEGHVPETSGGGRFSPDGS